PRAGHGLGAAVGRGRRRRGARRQAPALAGAGDLRRGVPAARAARRRGADLMGRAATLDRAEGNVEPSLGAGILARVFLRSLLLQASWNPRGMQNLGFAYAMWPALEHLYP